MTVERLRREIYRIISLQKSILSLGPPAAKGARSILDFKEKKKESLREQLESAIRSIKENEEAVSQIRTLAGDEKAMKARRLIKGLSQEKDLLIHIESIAEIVSSIPKAKRPEKLKLPREIRDDVMEDLDEIDRCLKAGCYRSVMILAGRVLETVLHRKYYEITGNDLLEKSPGIGLGKIIAKLREKNASLDPGLSEQIHLINQVRIHSVHQKKDNFRPTKEQAQAIVLYTIDVIKKI